MKIRFEAVFMSNASSFVRDIVWNKKYYSCYSIYCC